MAFAYVPREKTNSATGLINLTRNLGGSVGISLVAAAQSRLAQVSQSSLAGNVTAISPLYANRLHQLQGALQASGSDPIQAAHQAQAILYGEMLRQSSMVAYVDVFRLLAWLCVGLIPLMFFMKPAKPRAGSSVPVH
jgi:DHA2 family multidrug resistance protein